jgi:molecular chaperone GrpE
MSVGPATEVPQERQKMSNQNTNPNHNKHGDEQGDEQGASEASAAADGQDGLDPGTGLPADELAGMEQAVDAAQQELLQHRDAMLRMQAEMDNLRKRLIRDQERARKFALENIMKDLLQVRDSLERALAVAPENATIESLREGEDLTLKLLSKVLGDHGLEVLDPRGEAFNPEWHQAVAMLPSAEAAPNTVLEVMQKGFRLHERLIRPAMVVVAKSPG